LGGKETIMNSYIENEKMQNLVKNYENKNILDGDSFCQIFKKETRISEHLNKNATFLGSSVFGS